MDDEVAKPTQAAGQDGLRPCPHCLERIPAEATVCRSCGRDVPAAAPAAAPVAGAPRPPSPLVKAAVVLAVILAGALPVFSNTFTVAFYEVVPFFIVYGLTHLLPFLLGATVALLQPDRSVGSLAGFGALASVIYAAIGFLILDGMANMDIRASADDEGVLGDTLVTGPIASFNFELIDVVAAAAVALLFLAGALLARQIERPVIALGRPAAGAGQPPPSKLTVATSALGFVGAAATAMTAIAKAFG
jgi:hypothetical protein